MIGYLSLPTRTTAVALVALAAFCLPVPGAARGGKPTKRTRGSGPFSIRYSSPTEDVEVTGTKIVSHVRKMEFANPVAAAPTKTVTVRREGSVSPQEIAQLRALLRSTQFFALEDAYGAKPEERNYPTTIEVKDGGREKRVVYRSSPAAEKPPDTFFRIEQGIQKLAADRARTQR